MQAELLRLQQVNLTVGSEEFDTSQYPAFVGIDVRNGKTLIEKFICWDGCPELGNVYLVYQGVATKEACLNVEGSPLISPVPIPGAYWDHKRQDPKHEGRGHRGTVGLVTSARGHP